jgi:hypothetical protein
MSDVHEVERDIAAVVAARAELTDRLPVLRADRIQAARSMLLAGASRKPWQAAFLAEIEAVALLSDVDAIAAALQADLAQARRDTEFDKQEARLAGRGSRLRRIAAENGLQVPESGEFLRDVALAYGWLSTVQRSDIDRQHSHSWWLDRMIVATRRAVPTQAFVAAVMCHGDIAIEIGDYAPSFGLNEHFGKPAASLPLTGDPTPSINRALITTKPRDGEH